MPVASPLTRRLALIAEIARNKLMPTSFDVLTVADESLQTFATIVHSVPAPSCGAAFRVCVLCDLVLHHHCISVTVFAAVVEHADGSFAVSACAAGFLVVSFEGLGDLPVCDEAHVVLVDSHAECSSCYDNVVAIFVCHPSVQMVVFFVRLSVQRGRVLRRCRRFEDVRRFPPCLYG